MSLKEWRSRGLRGRTVQSRIECGITAWAVSPMFESANNKHTMKKHLLFIGLDVHAKNITIALAPGDGSAARPCGALKLARRTLDAAWR